MLETIRSLPILPAVLVLWVIVLARAGGTYALGRLAARLTDRWRVATVLEGPRVARALEAVRRWGAPVVAASFLTVGFQTAANAAAGVLRMPLPRYLPALAIGGLAWAVIYATIGLAALAVWLELFLRSPWAAVAVLVIVPATALAIMLTRRRRHRPGTAPAAAHRSRRRSDGPDARTR